MLVGLWMLRGGFTGKVDHFWWMMAFWIQFFHHIEHAHPADAGDPRAQPAGPPGADQPGAAVGAAGRAASLLQHHRVHPDGDRDVLPPVPAGRGEDRRRSAPARCTPRDAAARGARGDRGVVRDRSPRDCRAAATQGGRRSPAPSTWPGRSARRRRIVGPATLTITLRGPAGSAVRAATVRLEGHMSHPGMAPVLADARPSAARASTTCRSRSRCRATGCCSSPSRCRRRDASSVASTWRTSGRPDDARADP